MNLIVSCLYHCNLIDFGRFVLNCEQREKYIVFGVLLLFVCLLACFFIFFSFVLFLVRGKEIEAAFERKVKMLLLHIY